MFPSPEDLLDPRIEPGSPALQADPLPSELQGKPQMWGKPSDTGVGSLSLLKHPKTHVYPWASLLAQTVKRLPVMRETWVRFLGQEDPLEKEMAIHSSTLAWKIPWTEEPHRLQSMGSQRVGHD